MDSASLVEPLSTHPQLLALTSLVRASAIDAAHARRADYASRERPGTGPTMGPGHIPEGLTSEEAETPYGNVLTVLEQGADSEEERALLGALLALSLRQDAELDEAAAFELTCHLVWLAAHTPCNALTALDAALAEAADVFWRAIAELLDSPDRAPEDFGRTEVLVAAASLRRASHRAARSRRVDLAERTPDPEIYALLGPGPEHGAEELSGEVQPAPRGFLLTTVMALTLVLFVMQLVRVIGRYAFGYKRPASLRVGPQGLELSQRIELMNRVLRDRAVLLPLSAVARVTREVKYARAGLYVGLAALTLGTYLGTGMLVDGVRVPGGSGPLLGLAAVFIIVGLATDFVLSSGADTLRGRCRVVVVPLRGRTLCVGGLDPTRADALLAALAEQMQRRDHPPADAAPEEPPRPRAPTPVPAENSSEA